MIDALPPYTGGFFFIKKNSTVFSTTYVLNHWHDPTFERALIISYVNKIWLFYH